MDLINAYEEEIKDTREILKMLEKHKDKLLSQQANVWLKEEIHRHTQAIDVAKRRIRDLGGDHEEGSDQ
jgi:hypothetical protein